MVITVSCPSCATSFPVDPNKIPEAGVKVRCSQCAHVFRVERPAPEPEVETPDAAGAEGPAMDRDPFAEAASEGTPPDAEAAVEVAESGREPSSSEDLPDWARGGDVGPAAETEAPGAGEPTEPKAPAPTPETRMGAPTPEPVERSEPVLADAQESIEAERWPGTSPDEEPDAAPAQAAGPETALPPADAEPDHALPEPEPEAALPQAEHETAEALPEPEPSLHGTPAPSLEPEPIPEPTPYDPDTVAEPEPAETAAAPTPEPHTPPVQGFTFGKRDPMDKARRLARVLVSDMVMYNADRHRAALAQGTLEEDFEEEIDKSWKEYVDQVGPDLAEGEGKHFWTQALNDILAKGQRVF